ncbi:hypothetical protein INT44_001991 [Umbelopsis vinacea]|uniref:Ketoreductase domain-containing protein n=1 Tax=Umbelopsis vinacea TaxID=44442 RepID=A0A8H7Q3L4_9FUNG|nr:hypothetical protein INT44_001991 [Umbelopsis vinacea]
MGRLEGKVVLVTGASAGIGAACAKEFAKEGSHLIITGRRLERLESLKNELTSQYPNQIVHPIALDVRRRDAVNGAIAALPTDLKNIDVLVNNAGLVIGLDKLSDVTEDAIDTMLDTNVKGLVYLTQAVLPGMKEQKKGHIINVGSVSGKQVYAGGGIYCASKHAVDAISRTLLLELVDTPLRVTQINPGMVNTEFSTVRFGGDSKKADAVYKGLQPLAGEDIAEIVTFAASRPPHVNIADVLVFPTAQADARTSHRE